MNSAVQRIAAAFESGYDWPLDWNEECRRRGNEAAVIALPSETERIGRACLWAWNTAREILSDAIHPDGPRGR